MFGDSERLLVLHDGRLLIRLDPSSGSRRWACLLGTQDLSERPGAMVYDDRRFYCVNTDTIYGGPRQAVRAISLEDGSPIWSRALSGPRETPVIGPKWPGRSRSPSAT